MTLVQQAGQAGIYKWTNGAAGKDPWSAAFLKTSITELAQSTLLGAGLSATLGSLLSRFPVLGSKIVFNSPNSIDPLPIRVVEPTFSPQDIPELGSLADTTGGNIIRDAGGQLTVGDETLSLPAQGSMSTEDAIAWEQAKSALLPKLLDSTATVREQAYEAVQLENAIIVAARNAMSDASAAAQLSITDPIKSFDQMVAAESGSYGGNALFQKVIQDRVAAGTQLRPVSAQNGCFVAGTLVHIKDGLIPIERIKVGDWVLSQPEMKGERTYKRVVRTMQFDEMEVVCVDVWKDGERAGFVVTRNHPFWVKDVGWTAVSALKVGAKLELADGGSCDAYNRSQLYRTPVDGIAWMEGEVDSLRGFGVGRTIDLRGGTVRIGYDKVPNPGVETGNDSSILRARVYNFEVEDHHTYYVGEWGVWVHNANCAQRQVVLSAASKGLQYSPTTQYFSQAQANALAPDLGTILVTDGVKLLSDSTVAYQIQTPGAMTSPFNIDGSLVPAGKTNVIAWGLRGKLPTPQQYKRFDGRLPMADAERLRRIERSVCRDFAGDDESATTDFLRIDGTIECQHNGLHAQPHDVPA